MFKNYEETRAWLENFIPHTWTRKELGLERIGYLLKLLGNPQNKFKSIHVVGTSGKGSTAFYISGLLQYNKLQTPNSKLQTPSSKLWRRELVEGKDSIPYLRICESTSSLAFPVSWKARSTIQFSNAHSRRNWLPFMCTT